MSKAADSLDVIVAVSLGPHALWVFPTFGPPSGPSVVSVLALVTRTRLAVDLVALSMVIAESFRWFSGKIGEVLFHLGLGLYRSDLGLELEVELNHSDIRLRVEVLFACAEHVRDP